MRITVQYGRVLQSDWSMMVMINQQVIMSYPRAVQLLCMSNNLITNALK